MKSLVKIKPGYFILVYFLFMLGGFFVSISLNNFIVKRSNDLDFIVPALFFILPMVCCLLYLGFALDLIDTRLKNQKDKSHYLISVTTLSMCPLLAIIITTILSQIIP
jgi:hypothetical protein